EGEHVELAVAQLARVGEHALHVLACAGRWRAAVRELGELQLLGERRAEARLVGAAAAAGIDLAGAGRCRERGACGGAGDVTRLHGMRASRRQWWHKYAC